jgi:hypothetical protein
MDGTVTVAKSIAEAEALRPAWQAAGICDLDAQIDYFLTVTGLADNVVRPHVVHVRRDGLPDLMAVARIERINLPVRLAYGKLGTIRRPAVLVALGGLLGCRGPQDDRLLLRHLMQPLESGEADLLMLRNLDTAGSFLVTAAGLAGWLRRSRGTETTERLMTVLPENLDALLNRLSSKRRRRIRSMDRKVTAEYGERAMLRRLDRLEDMPVLLRDMERVAATTYQRGLGVGFMNGPIDRALIELGLRQGSFRSWFLYIDGVPVAFWTGVVCGRNFLIGTPGFDPHFAHVSAGRFTMLRMLEDLCADPRVDVLDLGSGEADYKALFGQCVRREASLLVAAPRLVPIGIVQLLSAFTLANRHGKRLLARGEWARKLRKKWRERMEDDGAYGEEAA